MRGCAGASRFARLEELAQSRHRAREGPDRVAVETLRGRPRGILECGGLVSDRPGDATR
jgi:hypothetical protein